VNCSSCWASLRRFLSHHQLRIAIVVGEPTDEDGDTIFRQACRMGLEGLVSGKPPGLGLRPNATDIYTLRWF
jgi:ATP-dependent DNA ligase